MFLCAFVFPLAVLFINEGILQVLCRRELFSDLPQVFCLAAFAVADARGNRYRIFPDAVDVILIKKGVKEIDRVNKRVTLCFREVPLAHCEGELPVDGGLVKVSWRRDNGKSEYSYSVPIGYEGIVEEEK